MIQNSINWFQLIIGVTGGLGLFLYGMNLMSSGLKKAAGDKLRSILSRLTENRFYGLTTGAAVTMLIQSSSASSVMLVGLVQAGLIGFGQSFSIVLGANIGTTITAQIVAFKLTDYALFFVAIGISMQFLADNPRVKTIGETIFGFGLLFFGMEIMSRSMDPLRSYQPFVDILTRLENPLAGIGIGAVFTAVIQSSSAFTGILIVLASQGLLTLEAGIPLVLGSNIGTSITAGLAVIGARREAKRVALAHTLIKVFGMLLFIFWMPGFAELIRSVSPGTTADAISQVVPREIANAHTIFNLATALILLPFVRPATLLIEKLLPDRPDHHLEIAPKYLDKGVLGTPALALNLAKAEALRIGNLVQENTRKAILPFTEHNQDVINDIIRGESQINDLTAQVEDYLTRITRQSIPSKQTDEAFQIMYTVTEFEQIGDIITKIILPRSESWLANNLSFSEEGKKELLDFHERALKQISRALDVFDEVNLEKARAMKQKHKKYRSMSWEFMRTHYKRLRSEVAESEATSEVHQDLIEQFRRISGHATNVARILLEWKQPDE